MYYKEIANGKLWNLILSYVYIYGQKTDVKKILLTAEAEDLDAPVEGVDGGGCAPWWLPAEWWLLPDELWWLEPVGGGTLSTASCLMTDSLVDILWKQNKINYFSKLLKWIWYTMQCFLNI